MDHCKAHFLDTSEDGFIIRPTYIDIHPSHVLHNVIGQLRTSLHQLDIEVGRYSCTPLEEFFSNGVIKECYLFVTEFILMK